MIKIIDGNLFDSKANFIVHQVNCQGVMGSGVALQIAERFPHVKKDYIRYVNYCNKNDINLLGTVQYVPTEVWALMMVDTMKNNNVIAFDTNYQYIVNLFGQDTYGEGLQTDLKAMKKAFVDIREKAKKIGATVAMPYNIGSCRGGADWNDVYNIIKNVFDKSNIDVEIWRYDLG
jgi:O-acetyl-ADP-ribose deacetylase (regulator of RNase III)